MKITELNLEKFSLKNIAIQFSQATAEEMRILSEKIYRVGSKVQFDQQSLLAFFNIYQLENLIENWKNQDLEKIFNRHKIIWAGKNFSFDLTLNPIVYSIVNVTPDSFYDGAKEHLTLPYILKRAENDLANGASVLELGGKSSRPGYSDITPEQEWQRLEVALKELRKQFPKAIIAIDTDEPYVMTRVLDAGADIINDIDGFETAEKLKVLENYHPAVVAMNNGRAGFAHAENVYEELPQFFAKKQEELIRLGLKNEQICIDAGVGFFNGDSGRDSVERVKSTELLTPLGLPIMVAISRKSFMKNVFGYDGDERLLSTLMLEAQMIADGGRVLRVHDVLETKRMIDAFKIYQKF